MENVHSLHSLADRAAKLMPGPPDDGDVAGYLAWREFVWETALRIGRLAGDLLALFPQTHEFTDDEPVTAEYLLRLGSLICFDQQAAPSYPMRD